MVTEYHKDMTASELLRWAGNGEEHISPIDGNSWTAFSAKLKSFVEVEIGDWPNDERLCDYLADKIDAELAQATAYGISEGFNSSLRAGAELWAKANGWPGFRDGEDFGAWLDRCALPRPRFEDGEPVQFGDNTDELNGVEKFIFTRSCGGSCQMQDADGNILNVFPGGFVKRPAPDALGADGKPIKAGETVYDIETGEAYIVRLPCAGTGKTFFEGGGYRDPAYLTHTPPDTQERIDGDAAKDHVEYWRCSGFDCAECPSKIDGEKPWERYECSGACCDHAMMLDLLRRQRELDKRTGGE